ncbi:MAG TPA: hypothetical protein VKE74_06415 [Gemmataceae bacterium]|nr:hypothetical protein [Gemmataceae bacterium]
MTAPTTSARESDSSREAKRLAAVVLDVLAGSRSPPQAAETLGVSLPRYYQLEARALEGLLAACESRPRGRQPDREAELTGVRKELERLKRELARAQSLVRLTQRTVGVAPPPPAKPGKRKRKPVVRAMRRADQLREEAGSGTEPPGEGVTA